MSPENIRWNGTISIQCLLSEIRSDESRPFWLAFVRATGKRAGSIKVVSKAIYGAPAPKEHGAVAKVTGRSISLHTEKGTLPLTDATTGEYLTPLISHIVGYNLKKVFDLPDNHPIELLVDVPQ